MIFPSILVKRKTPINPPITPGIIKLRKSFLLIFPSCQWLNPEAPVVNISAILIAPLAITGEKPLESRNVVAVIPYAIPRAPSTICATRPTNNPEIKISLLNGSSLLLDQIVIKPTANKIKLPASR